jgi:hypothetical protein
MFRLFRRAPNPDAPAINGAQPRWVILAPRPCSSVHGWGRTKSGSWRTRAPPSVVCSTLAGGNFDFLILSGQLSGLVLLPDWDVLVLSVNTFTAARLSIVHRSDQVRIPFSVQATAVNDAEASAERHGYAICCCPGYQRTRYLLPRRSQSTYQLGCLRIERGPGWCQFFYACPVRHQQRTGSCA